MFKKLWVVWKTNLKTSVFLPWKWWSILSTLHGWGKVCVMGKNRHLCPFYIASFSFISRNSLLLKFKNNPILHRYMPCAFFNLEEPKRHGLDVDHNTFIKKNDNHNMMIKMLCVFFSPWNKKDHKIDMCIKTKKGLIIVCLECSFSSVQFQERTDSNHAHFFFWGGAASWDTIKITRSDVHWFKMY